MKQYPHLTRAVYYQPWLITADAHAAIRAVLESRLTAAQLALPKAGDIVWGETDLEGEPLPSMQVIGDIARIPVRGTIMKGATGMDMTCGAVAPEMVARDLRAAAADARIKGIFLDVCSPGGYTVGVPELGRAVVEARRAKPVLTYTDELIASAAYWFAAGSTAIYASDSARIGSIGCYTYLLDWSKYYEEAGVKPELIVSKGSDLKATGAPGLPLTQPQRAELQRSVDRINAAFHEHVAAHRGTVDPALLRGQCVDGLEARAGNLIDSVSDEDTAWRDLLAMSR